MRRAPRYRIEPKSRAPPTGRPARPRLCRTRSRGLPDDSHFELQRDARLLGHYAAHVFDQVLDVRRSRPPLSVDDEIRVLLRHARAADGKALETRGFDETRRMIVRRIAKHASRVGQLERLRRDPPRQQLLDPGTRRIAVARRKAKPPRGENALGGTTVRALDAPVTDRVVGGRAYRERAVAREHFDFRDVRPDFAAVASGIHG